MVDFRWISSARRQHASRCQVSSAVARISTRHDGNGPTVLASRRSKVTPAALERHIIDYYLNTPDTPAARVSVSTPAAINTRYASLIARSSHCRPQPGHVADYRGWSGSVLLGAPRWKFRTVRADHESAAAAVGARHQPGLVSVPIQPSTRTSTIMASLTRKARWTTWATVLAMLVVPTACETLRDPLTVEPASRIPAGVAEISVNAQLLSDGAIADFECAFGSYTSIGGLVGEEFIYAQQTASRSPYDRRNTSKDDADYAINACNSGSPGVYTPLQVSRASNENLIRLLNSWTDAESRRAPASRTDEPARDRFGICGYSFVFLGRASARWPSRTSTPTTRSLRRRDQP